MADPSLDEINDWLRVQGALEALAGELACANATDAELTEIELINASIKEARSADGLLVGFRRDIAFHEAIVAASGNPALRETHASYDARLWRVRFLSSQRIPSREGTRSEHLEMVEALKSRGAKAARRALKQHLRTAETNVPAVIAGAERTKEDE